MALLGSLLGFGLSQRRGYGSSMLGRSIPRSRGYSSYGRARAPVGGIFGGSLGRMAMGGAAAMLTRSLMNRRYRSY
ncbi:MAG TPA: hypothetical protein VF815_10270 [Myxococcaceae bacterium]|jgi:hypothetical protein